MNLGRLSLALAMACGAAAGLAVVAPAARAQGEARVSDHLPIHRITLYRSGVGSFERRGAVDGDSSVQLRFKTEQINDILKSMIVLDLSKGQGTIDGISYASREPLSRRLGSFGIDLSDNPPAGEVLARLRGTKVRVTIPGGEVSGVVMNVEKKPTVLHGSGEKPAVHDLPWINLVTEKGVRSVSLADATGFEILDAALAAELNKALEAVAEHRADRTKAVDIKLRGQGSREIVVAYVQEAPVWKTSYRLVLPDMPAKVARAEDLKQHGTPTIQGWAIVENTTDEDWTNVRLGLVAGRPVSFRMDLYEPLYVYRPEIPVPTVPGVMPRSYAAGEENKKPGGTGGALRERGFAKDAAVPAPSAAPGSPSFAGGRTASQAMNAESDALRSEDLAGYAAQAQAAGVEAGEVFQFELNNPVTVERQRSAMLPILASGVEGRRVSIFNANDSAEHPMRGVEITNTSGLQLMPGPISVFDGGSYAGDAQIGHVPSGDKRLLAYSLDLDVTARRDYGGTNEIRKLRIVKGLLETTQLEVNRVKYLFTNKDLARARTVVVEQPKIEGWDLRSPASAYETTKDLYRFEVGLDAGAEAALTVEQSHTLMQTWSLTDYDLNAVVQHSQQGKASKAVVDAMREAGRRQGAILDVQRQIAELEGERNTIAQDQDRIRKNMSGLDRTTDLYNRYVRTLNDQETRLEAMNKSLVELKARHTQLQGEMAEWLRGLDVE